MRAIFSMSALLIISACVREELAPTWTVLTENASEDTEAEETTSDNVCESFNRAECNIFMQDCPFGQKCRPGPLSWETTPGFQGLYCVHVAEQTQSPGERCEIILVEIEGKCYETDNCDADSMCLNGYCHLFCSGSVDKPYCPKNTYCKILDYGIGAVCK